MSAQEQLKLDIISKCYYNKMDIEKASQILDVTARTIYHMLSRYKRKGSLSIKHGNYGKQPENKTPADIKETVIKLVRENYYDFNMLHCLEKLKTCHGITINRETFRKWCHEINHVKKAKRRKAKARYKRQRMLKTGMLLQMDGSPHRWFGGKESVLITAIDDADSDIPFAEFFPAEDTLSCMTVLQKIIEKKGLFEILYVDRAGIFGGPKRCKFSQVTRALEELGIHTIFANSPQAKGRVERLFGTLQDRLIPEMRIRRIKSYQAANCYLQEQYLVNEYAPKFKVVPRNLETVYKPLPLNKKLNEIFCLKEHRTVNRDHTLSWNGQKYSLISPVKYSIHKQKIEIRTYQDLTWKAYYADKEISLTLVEEPIRLAA